MKFKKILNNIGMLLILTTIVIFNLIIGGNEKALPIFPMCIILGLVFTILLIKKIKYKEKLIKSKIDIAVSLFTAILFLPLIFGTYCSLEGTTEFILKYVFVYCIYLLTRNIVDTKNKYNIVVATTVISSLIIIVFGIDIQHGNRLNWLYNKLDLVYNVDFRFSSTFGYANAVSIYVLFCVFLSINRIENLKKILPKIFYFAYLILGTYIIYISYSRVVLILYVLSIFSYLGAKVYSKVKDNKEFLRKILFITIIAVGIILIYLIIAIRIPEPYIIDQSFKLRKNLKLNAEYEFKFDIDVKTNFKDTTGPHLIILEVNKYYNEKEIGRIVLNPNKKTYSVKINTSEDFYYIKFLLINRVDKKVAINHFYIDNEEYVFSPKYIPSIISRLIKSFTLKDDSIVQRIQFYENSIRIAKDSLIIGHGGNAWKRLALAYEDYPYEVKETHSYFFELLICYGIIGLATFLGMVTIFCVSAIKDLINHQESRKLKLSVFIGLMLMLIYNITFDFGMSFIVLILATFQFIALMQLENEEEINIKYIDTAALIIIGSVVITLITSFIAKYVVKDVKLKAKLAPYVVDYNVNAMDEDNLEDIKSFIKKEPYLRQNDMYRLYWDKLYEKRNILPIEEIQEYVNFGIKTFEKRKCVSPIYFTTILDRVKIMTETVKNFETIENTEESIDTLKELIKKEYNINIEYLKDENRNHKSKHEIERAIETYKVYLKSVKIEVD